MAEFTADLQSFRPLFPFLDIDNMELINQFKGVMNPHVLDNSILNMQNLMSFSRDNFLSSSETEFPGNLEEDFPAGLVHCVINHTNAAPVSLPVSSAENEIHDEGKKRKATDMCGPSSENSSPAVSHSENKTKDSSGRGKRVKRDTTEDEKPKEVVHVRARRGQATDSHSLAERVRRGKINEKLRFLQNIVPGCYKTMGMAIMLDEIINYVQSLQHQVEFLSMKLTAASTFHDFNSDTDSLETMQRTKASEAKDKAKYVREGYDYDGFSCFQPPWSQSL